MQSISATATMPSLCKCAQGTWTPSLCRHFQLSTQQMTALRVGMVCCKTCIVNCELVDLTNCQVSDGLAML